MEAARRPFAISLLLAALAGCSFKTYPGIEVDAEIIADASMCTGLTSSCASPSMLHKCETLGQLPAMIDCPWGCIDDAAPHCGRLDPTGTVMSEMDFDPLPGLTDQTMTSPAGTTGEINTDTGAITGVRPAVQDEIQNGIWFAIRTFDAGTPLGSRSVGVFRFGKLRLVGDWRVVGANAIAIASLGDVTIEGHLDLRGDCMDSNPGPGGFAGGAVGATASGSGGGQGGSLTGGSSEPGGGGGGYGSSGGIGGRSTGGAPLGGPPWGPQEITLLIGGGGGGGGDLGGRGGGGGGAIHIAANGRVTIRSDAAVTPSGINAGGCGGKAGNVNGGGGGGSGGSILIEGSAVELDGAHLAVNGGGGGGNAAAPNGDGQSGRLELARADGGQGGGGGTGGGGGAGMGNLTGAKGGDNAGGGGGGGGVGRIRINSRSLLSIILSNGGTMSPMFGETNTTATKDISVVR